MPVDFQPDAPVAFTPDSAIAFTPDQATTRTGTELPFTPPTQTDTAINPPRSGEERAGQDYAAQVKLGLDPHQGIDFNPDAPLLSLPQPNIPGFAANQHPIATGVAQAMIPAINSLTTPRNLEYMAGSMGIGSAGVIGKALVGAFWTAFMGANAVKDAPRIASELGDEMGKPEDQRDKQKIARLLTEAGIDTAMTVAPAVGTSLELHELTGAKPLAYAKIDTAIAPTAPATAEALKTTLADFQEQAKQELPQATPTPEVPNAVPEQKPNEEVLRNAQPEVGLQEVGARNAQPEISAQPQEPVSPGQETPNAPGSEQGIVQPDLIPTAPIEPPSGRHRGYREEVQGVTRPDDIIDEIRGIGKIRPKSNMKPGHEGYYGQYYEEASGSGAGRSLFSKNARIGPDEVVQSLRDKDVVGQDFSVDDLWHAISAANETRRTFFKGELPEQKQNRFFQAQKELSVKKNKQVISVGEMSVGDKFTLKGEDFEVSGIDPDTGEVTVKDGRKFGAQTIPDGSDIVADAGSHVPVEQNPEFAPKEQAAPIPKLRTGEKAGEMFQGEDQPFNLIGEKGTDAERIAAEKAKAIADAAEAKRIQDQQQQGFTGMGGAVPGEFGGNESVTSNMFAAIERDRAEMGKPPLENMNRSTWDAANQKALARMNRDPHWTENLINEVLNKPRVLEPYENAALVWQRHAWKAELNNALQRISSAFDDGREADLAEAKLTVARFEDKLEELDRAVGPGGTGSKAGEALQAQKMGTGEDFSLIEMRLAKRAAVGGRPLTDAESAKIKELHDQIAEAKKAYEADLALKNLKIAEMEVKAALDKIALDAKREPVVEPHVRLIADKIKGYFDARADAARKRLSGKLFTLSPQVLADLTDLGVSTILSGAIDLGKWSAKMVDELGDKVKPHLQTIWEASHAALDEHIKKVAGISAPKVTRAVRDMDINEKIADVTKKIGDRIAAGKKTDITGLVQKLSRYYVEQGIKERDPLIDAVHAAIQKVDPEFTRRQTMDAISGYGDFKQLSKDQISRELRDLKGQMQQVAKLEDMQAGKPPLKTGIERREVSKEESRLIKQVNEAKNKFQIPITDPNTQLKSSLDTLKTRIGNRIDELNQKMAAKDFSTRPRHEISLDHAAMELKAKYERAKLDYDRELLRDRLRNETPLQKTSRFLRWLRRESVLSGPTSLAKLTSAAIEGLTLEPLKEAVGKGVSLAFPEFARRTTVEGPSNVRIEAKALTEAFTKFMRDSAETIKTGTSNLEMAHGGKRPVPEEMVSYFGRLHAALKTPLKRAAFTRVFAKLTEQYIRDGIDVTEPLVQMRMGVLAMKEANRMLFLEDNKLVSAYQRALSAFEQKEKATGKPTVLGTVVGGAARIMLPIVRIPTNIIARTVQAAVGFPVGATKLAIAYAKGIKELPPEQADLIMRQLKQGSIGAAFMLFGYFNADKFGGYYQPGEKRKAGDVKASEMRTPFGDLPTWLLHHPLLQVAQLGATVRRVADSKLHKKDSTAQGLGAGIEAGLLGLIEEAPFSREILDLAKLRNPTERQGIKGEYLKSLVVPQGVQWAARQMDKNAQGDVIKRKPTTMIEHLKTGIPGLREEVPKASAKP